MYEIMLITIHIIISLCSRMVRSSHIVRAVLGPSKNFVVPCWHGTTCLACLEVSTGRHEARECRAGPARPKSQL
jgi:hypothetical protein